MSTIRANAIVDASGGNTATINGITPALASQAQAEAGTDNTTLMTPLRVAQEIATLSGLVLLGTLTTTSGATQTLSSLDLTGYEYLLFDINAVSHNSGTTAFLRVGSGQVSDAEAASQLFYGNVWVSLYSGYNAAHVDANGSMPRTGGSWRSLSGYTTASTSVSVSISAGAFDAGSIRVYGVK